jgi:hypothetical protein
MKHDTVRWIILAAALLVIGWLCLRHVPKAKAAQIIAAPKIDCDSLACVIPVQKLETCGYAVECGGIHSLDQLKFVIATDKLAASLYAGFDFASARITKLKHSETGYVAYRRDGHIFYTHAARTIRAGEEVITDKNGMTILTRCGNLVQLVPQLTSDVPEPGGIYPPIVVTSYPVVAPPQDIPALPPFVDLTPPIVTSPLETGITSSYTPVYSACCSVGPGPNAPPVKAPEPSEWELLVVGVGLCLLLAKGVKLP